MKVHLLHQDEEFVPKAELRDGIFKAMLSGNLFAITAAKRDLERQQRSGPGPESADIDQALEQDLELGTLWSAMAAGDEFLFEVAKRVTLSSLRHPDAIRYRQQVLADCLEHPATVRELYELAIEALASERKLGALWEGGAPTYILHHSVRLLEVYLGMLRRLRAVADEQGRSFQSDGFKRFFASVGDELDDEYLETVERHLAELELKRGVLESAQLGKGDKGRRYILHETPPDRTWWERLPVVGAREPELYRFELHPRDEAGFRALGEIQARAINHVADAVAQSADHVKSFFIMLRFEFAFYLGCLNLRAWLERKDEPTCWPDPVGEGEMALTADGIYDACLTLHLSDRAVGNDIAADRKSLVMISGANQGGKSTLLRALGLAQLMMQAGMFVGARSFRANVCSGLFSHYKREEDETMERGKLDEELSRMSAIADRIAPASLLLCNESFASTNEREGSEIARQVTHALLDKRVKVLFVTHMYDLAHSLYGQRLDGALFLRAEREADGRRTFKLREGEPLPTSFGPDSYRRIFGVPQTAPSRSPTPTVPPDPHVHGR